MENVIYGLKELLLIIITANEIHSDLLIVIDIFYQNKLSQHLKCLTTVIIFGMSLHKCLKVYLQLKIERILRQ